MKDKVLATIQAYNMLPRGGKVAACVSGGADSVALLHILCSMRNEWRLTLAVLHLNHCLRGAESDADEQFVRELCGSLGVELVCRRADVRAHAAQKGLSLEEAGRALRYSFFEEYARETGCVIATAHNQNDCLETALINLARGTGPRGLCGVPPVRGAVVRPLIGCARAEIEAYLRENSLPYRVDSSNLDDAFTRNRIRRDAVPALLHVNSQALANAAETALLLRQDTDFLDRLAEVEAARLFDGQSYSRQGFLSLDPALSSRLLMLLLRRHGAECNRARIGRLMEIIRLGSGREQLRPRLFFSCDADIFCMCNTPEGVPEPFRLSVQPERFPFEARFDVFSSKKLHLTGAEYEYYEEFIKIEQNQFKNVLDYDRINWIIECRTRIPGDRIRLAGRGCTKTLKNLFQEAKIPESERLFVLVLADSDGPIWVEGFGAAERVAAGPETRRILLIKT